jgi:hypothetical protein
MKQPVNLHDRIANHVADADSTVRIARERHPWQ